MTTTDNNGLQTVILDLRPKVEPHNPDRGNGREVLRNVYFRIIIHEYDSYLVNHSVEAQSKEKEAVTAYDKEITDMLKADGWEPYDDSFHFSHSCPEFVKGSQYLYCHPQEVCGSVADDNIGHMEALLRTGKTFKYSHTDNYRDVIVTADKDDELQLYHELYDSTIRDIIRKATTTPRRNLYVNRYGAWQSVGEKIRLETRCLADPLAQCYYQYAREKMNELIADGWIIATTNANDAPLVRWLNKAETKAKEKQLK